MAMTILVLVVVVGGLFSLATWADLAVEGVV